MTTNSFTSRTSDNLAAVLYGKKDLRVEEFPMSQQIGSTEARIRVHTVAVSGLDVNTWKSGYLNMEQSPLTKPQIMGRETSGTVIAIGESVTTVKVGDRVHVHSAMKGFRSELYQSGEDNAWRSFPMEKYAHGHLRREMLADESMLYALPHNITFAEGAMLESLAVGVYACERGQLSAGHSVVIVGGGCVGTMALLAAVAGGATHICVLDIKKEKLDFVKTLGATHTLLVNGRPEEMGQKVREMMGCEPDICIDATGLESAIQTCIYAVKPRGKVVVAGLAPQTASLPLMLAAINEIDLIPCTRFGSWSYRKSYNLLASGKVNLKSCIGPKFPLTRATEAFETSSGGFSTNGVKCFIECEQ